MTARQPRLLGPPDSAPADEVRAAVLLLPGGSIRSSRPPLRLAEWALSLPRRMLEKADPEVATYLLHYRFRGWYAGQESGATAVDARWALDEIGRRHPNARVVLVGNSLGGRAAVAVADHPAVTAVVGLAPWLPSETGVHTLTGRSLFVVHGSADRSEAPAAWSLAFAERARAAGIVTARFVVPGDGHFLLRRRADWAAAITAVALSTVGGRPLPEPLRRGFDPSASLALPLPDAASLGG